MRLALLHCTIWPDGYGCNCQYRDCVASWPRRAQDVHLWIFEISWQKLICFGIIMSLIIIQSLSHVSVTLAFASRLRQ